GIESNVFHYSAVITSCEKLGKWELALSLLNKMPQTGVLPDRINYNAVISTCEKGGQWQLALSILNSMPDLRAMPNEISY
ncbi:unnamed protein product, partial [Polarella glacialis]